MLKTTHLYTRPLICLAEVILWQEEDHSNVHILGVVQRRLSAKGQEKLKLWASVESDCVRIAAKSSRQKIRSLSNNEHNTACF